MREWLERVSPDISATFRRFPFAILLLVFATAILLANVNGWITAKDELALRLFAGAATASVLAVAGALFGESRPRARVWSFLLTYVVPLAGFALFLVTDTGWLVPYALPVIAFLWLSVSASTVVGRGAVRDENQNFFWWLNYQALTSALIAGVALLLIALGIAAMERSLSILFGLETGGVFYQWILPILGCFFTPLYWLSTLPRLSAYDPGLLQEPDFLARTVGFLGQFVLTPLLLAYALILLTYVLQIALTRTIPQGVLGWMVLGFTVTGAATWLVLYPGFMRRRAMVRFFRSMWFWLTLPPLVLYAFAVWIRIDAYGLTPERLLLVWGGLWALTLSASYLLRIGDIRLVPSLAALFLLLSTIGPWNIENLPRLHQGMRLDALLAQPGPDGLSIPAQPDWTPEKAGQARGAIEFLLGTGEGREALRQVLSRHGHELGRGDGSNAIMSALGVDMDMPLEERSYALGRRLNQMIDVAATPNYVGKFSATLEPQVLAPLDLAFSLAGTDLVVSRGTVDIARVPLDAWVRQSDGTNLDNAAFDFAADGTDFRLVADLVSLTVLPGEEKRLSLNYVEGALFAGPATPKP